jgi:hypothetical protein
MTATPHFTPELFTITFDNERTTKISSPCLNSQELISGKNHRRWMLELVFAPNRDQRQRRLHRFQESCSRAGDGTVVCHFDHVAGENRLTTIKECILNSRLPSEAATIVRRQLLSRLIHRSGHADGPSEQRVVQRCVSLDQIARVLLRGREESGLPTLVPV